MHVSKFHFRHWGANWKTSVINERTSWWLRSWVTGILAICIPWNSKLYSFDLNSSLTPVSDVFPLAYVTHFRYVWLILDISESSTSIEPIFAYTNSMLLSIATRLVDLGRSQLLQRPGQLLAAKMYISRSIGSLDASGIVVTIRFFRTVMLCTTSVILRFQMKQKADFTLRIFNYVFPTIVV